MKKEFRTQLENLSLELYGSSSKWKKMLTYLVPIDPNSKKQEDVELIEKYEKTLNMQKKSTNLAGISRQLNRTSDDIYKILIKQKENLVKSMSKQMKKLCEKDNIEFNEERFNMLSLIEMNDELIKTRNKDKIHEETNTTK